MIILFNINTDLLLAYMYFPMLSLRKVTGLSLASLLWVFPLVLISQIFVPKLCQIGPKGEKSGTFQSEISSEKVPYVSQLRPIWPNFVAKVDIFLYVTPRTRFDGDSGIKNTRGMAKGSDNYYEVGLFGPSFNMMHDHSNYERTIGLLTNFSYPEMSHRTWLSEFVTNCSELVPMGESGTF